VDSRESVVVETRGCWTVGRDVGVDGLSYYAFGRMSFTDGD